MKLFAIQDSQNNFFIKDFNIGGFKTPLFGNDASIKIFNTAQDTAALRFAGKLRP